MKLFKSTAVTFTIAAALALGACSSDGDSGSTGSTTSTQSSASESAAASPQAPTAAELNSVLAVATDPAAPVDQKIATVQGSENAPELFETMTQAKAESGADFQVVDPVLPGYTPDTVLATVSFSLPDRPAQTADNVEFIHSNGQWQLSQNWACILITNTVQPEQVPPMCVGVGSSEAGAGVLEEAPAEEPAPAQ
ncbi:hypothetical protein [Corynebacterium pacaense]|uniref:hypothetical protein n=1 Tax=Corynebacterium pacaense TaxID=1816684 RepID=UPI0009BAFC6E|nr:hypothetical protein [Corynebacterium pacaense]